MELKVKNLKIIIAAILLAFISVQSVFAQEHNLIAEFSLFYESYKNNDYKSAEPHGWIVIDTDPSQFLKYRPFKKMEDIPFDLIGELTAKVSTEEWIAIYESAFKK